MIPLKNRVEILELLGVLEMSTPIFMLLAAFFLKIFEMLSRV
jgi:hypothetical protein